MTTAVCRLYCMGEVVSLIYVFYFLLVLLRYGSIKNYVHTSTFLIRSDLIVCAIIVWICTFLLLKNNIAPGGKVRIQEQHFVSLFAFCVYMYIGPILR